MGTPVTTATLLRPNDATGLQDHAATGSQVTLADGSSRNLDGLSTQQLLELQFEQEQAFAKLFLAAPRRSAARAEAMRQGYDTVTAIFAAANQLTGKPTVMGLDNRYERLVQKVIASQTRRGLAPRFFEVGYGCGVVLERAAAAGCEVAGIEVSTAMHREAAERLGPKLESRLRLGDFLSADLSAEAGQFSVCYWNDVFEHIPPDEIEDYLARIKSLLAPGGVLITITPNWHRRPMDVTGEFCPPRTEARGVHLKEYTLREVTALLRRAGFTQIATPLFVTSRRIALCGGGMAAIKRFFEPTLEWLPFRAADLLVRGLGLSCTIARA